MPRFADQAPTQLRGLALLALTDTGQVGAGTVVSDSGGGGTTTWTYGTAVPCRVDPVSGNESLVGGRIDERSTHLITTPPDLDLSASNRFAIAGRGTFEITAIQVRTGEWTRVFEAVQVS